MKTSSKLISDIVEIELKMFLAVPGDGSGNCQQNPESFKIHRKVQFCIWSEDTLLSYLDDLTSAEQEGDNLMTKKYAVIQGLIPQSNTSIHLNDVLRIQLDWQKEMLDNHPKLKGKARPLTDDETATQLVSFKSYARGELETYSGKTLELLHQDLKELSDKDVNGSLQIYTTLTKVISNMQQNH